MPGHKRYVASPLLLILILSSCARKTQDKPDLHPVNIKGKRILVEVAATPEARARGLQFRKQLPQDQGMLFVYPADELQTFWMKDTYVPLSIAFIRSDGWIAQIEDMDPLSLAKHSSKMRVKYVLEMNRGWFDKNGISTGDYADIPDDIAQSPFRR